MGMPAKSAFGMNDVGASSESKVQKKKFMILALGESLFAIHLHQVREVIATNQVTILPSMPDYFAGVINLRGRIISTVFLKKSLKSFEKEVDKSLSSKPCIVITDIQGSQFGAYVDDVAEVVSVESQQIDESMNQDVDYQDLFQGVLKFSDRKPIPILNMEKALRIEELKNRHNLENITQEMK